MSILANDVFLIGALLVVTRVGPVARGPQTETWCCSPETLLFLSRGSKGADRSSQARIFVFCRVGAPSKKKTGATYGWNVRSVSRQRLLTAYPETSRPLLVAS